MDNVSQLMSFFNHVMQTIPLSIIIFIVVVLVVVFLLFSYATAFAIGSRHHRFYRQENGELSLTVTYLLAGIVPIRKRRYRGILNTEVETYVEKDDIKDSLRARLYLNLASKEKVRLAKLIVNPHPTYIKKIANDIEELIRNQGQDELIINNGRLQSFILSLLVYPFFLPFIYMTIFSAMSMVLDNSDFLSERLETMVNEHSNSSSVVQQSSSNHETETKVYTESDLPAYIPRLEDGEIIAIKFKTKENVWEVWQKLPLADLAESEAMLKEKFKAEGWQYSQSSVFNRHDKEGNEIANSGIIFYIRNNNNDNLEGDVIILKKEDYLLTTFTVPVRAKAL